MVFMNDSFVVNTLMVNVEKLNYFVTFFSEVCVECLFPVESIGNAGANTRNGVSASSTCFRVYSCVVSHCSCEVTILA